MILLTACGGRRSNRGADAEVAVPPTATPEPTATEIIEDPDGEQASVDGQPGQGEPETVAFTSVDGTNLVGTFYPAAGDDVPVVVLMHMLNSERTAWEDFALQLYAEGAYAVLAFDFRGHGDSEGNFDRPLAIEDAKAAVAFAQTLDGVAQEQVILIGASIGSDAAVDACIEGCIAAASLSPGGWLGVPYAEALSLIPEKPVLCLASAADGSTVETCETGEGLGLLDYQVQVYQGRAHGTSMLDIDDQFPTPIDTLMGWLEDVVT